MERRAAGFVIFRRVLNHIEFLMLQASYGAHHWTPPKGHVDAGEDDLTTALRETKEETGYDVTDLKIHKDILKTLKYMVKGNPKIVTYWLAELTDPVREPTLSEEHENFKWLSKDEAKILCGFSDMGTMLDEFHKKAEGLK